jgi:biopolymer transport protein ExbB
MSGPENPGGPFAITQGPVCTPWGADIRKSSGGCSPTPRPRDPPAARRRAPGQEDVQHMSRFLAPIGFALATLVSFGIWYTFPQTLGDLGHMMYEAGPLVAVLILLVILVIAFVIERLWSLRKAQGTGPLPEFLNNVRKRLHDGDVDGAIEACARQRGSAANVIRAGLERYQLARSEGHPKDKVVAETQAAIQEANGLEVPLLERNLVALSTIASIGTMVGLLGTTIGMIRAFQALGQTGAVDAQKLSVGISEALINTALGLFTAIIGIVSFNVFTTKVDNFNYMMDEASYEAIQLLSAGVADKK